jgi:hypothetical protein
MTVMNHADLSQYARYVATEGGPGVGTLHLTVLAPFFPVPEESVLTGRISIHSKRGEPERDSSETAAASLPA